MRSPRQPPRVREFTLTGTAGLGQLHTVVEQRMRLNMRFTEQVRRHGAPVGSNVKVTVTEHSENGIRAGIPTRPGEWRISIHVFRLNVCSRAQQDLDRFFGSKGCSTVQGCFTFCSAIAHEATGFNGMLGNTVWIRSMAQEHFEDEIVSKPLGVAQSCVQWRLSRVRSGLIHVGTLLDQELTEAPMPVKSRRMEIKIVSQRLD